MKKLPLLPILALLLLSLAHPSAVWAHEGEDPGVNPDVQLIKPTPGQSLPAGPIEVRVDVHNIHLSETKIGETAISGEGHLHLIVDGKKIESADLRTVLAELAPGEHQLEVQLVNNNHTPLFPPVSRSVEFQVEEPTLLERAENLALPLAAVGAALALAAAGLIIARRR